MVEIKKITTRDLKNAKKILGCMEIIGVTQEELQLIKEIPNMQKAITELLAFKESVIKQNTQEYNATNSKNYADMIKDFKEVEEFNIYGRN